MGAVTTIAMIDSAIGALTAVMNFVGASQTVSNVIGQRIAEGRTMWTDAERKLIEDELAAAKAYAAQQIADAP